MPEMKTTLRQVSIFWGSTMLKLPFSFPSVLFHNNCSYQFSNQWKKTGNEYNRQVVGAINILTQTIF